MPFSPSHVRSNDQSPDPTNLSFLYYSLAQDYLIELLPDMVYRWNLHEPGTWYDTRTSIYFIFSLSSLFIYAKILKIKFQISLQEKNNRQIENKKMGKVSWLCLRWHVCILCRHHEWRFHDLINWDRSKLVVFCFKRPSDLIWSPRIAAYGDVAKLGLTTYRLHLPH
jgi:hypothetical protein